MNTSRGVFIFIYIADCQTKLPVKRIVNSKSVKLCLEQTKHQPRMHQE